MDPVTIILAVVTGVTVGLIMTNRKKYDDNQINSLSLSDFKKNMRKGQLIDIRKKEEYNKDKILGARNFAPRYLTSKYSKLRKDQTVYLYCANGRKSKRTAKKLAKNGYSQINILEGGFEGTKK